MKSRYLLIAILCFSLTTLAQDDAAKQKSLEIYGFAMMDAGYNFNQIHPDWFDVVRTTKLPTFKNQYGTDGNAYFSVRQTRFGVRGWHNTPLGELKTTFEFEMFGTGVDAGQTTIRLRHAYGELGKWGAGQYWSPFMDIDVFPNTVEYWGPPGMAFFRNVQVRYMPIQGDSRLTFALERPGASADQGIYDDRIELNNVKPRFALPDFSAEYRHATKWGYVELAGILRQIEWEDQNPNPTVDLSDKVLGWGLNLSTNVKLGSNTVFRGSYVYGEGVQNYMNDAPADIGIKSGVGGVTLPLQGIVAFIDHKWNDKFSTAIGYSSINIENSDGQADDAFKHGDYAIVNLMCTPVERVMFGAELQYGKRTNFKTDYEADILKLQFSFKYNFSHIFYKDAK